MSKICRPTIVCPYLLVCGKCSLDKNGNKICREEDISKICEYGNKTLTKKNKNKDDEQE